eukprot:jgi/Psemu1/284092/fgenesh1_pg.42_\
MDGIELSEVCSLSFFRATPLTEFRQKLNGCLKSNVRSFPSLKSPTSTTVTGNCIDDVTVTVTVTNHVSSGGALWEIVTAATNPVVVPQCCHGRCLVDVLLNALLLSPSFSASLRQQQERQRQRQRRQNNNHTQQQNISATAAAVVASRWTPSQQFLLETIQRLLASAGMASTVAATDSVMTKFVGKRPCHCTNNIAESLQRRKRKRSGLTTTTAISPDWSTVRSRAYKKFVSIAVERQRQHQRQRNTIPNATAISEETFLWFLVRDAAIHAESPSRRVCLALVAHSLGGPKNPYYFQMIAGLFWRGYCSSLRQPRAESSVTAYASAAASTWLRLYSEWLGECAVFDQREVLWEAIQPIVECVTTAITMRPKNDDGDGRHNDSVKQNHDACNHESERKEKHAGVNNEVDPALLACIGYILHRRFSMFQSRKKPSENHHQNSASNVRIEEGFRSFINVLSIHGGESSEPWLDLFSDSTGDYVESTLQRLGILSFSLSVAGEESSTRTDTRIIRHCDPEHFKTLDSLATEDWPFSKEFGTRNAMGRIEQSVLCLEHGNEAVVSLLVRPVKGGNGPSRKPKEPKKLKARVSSVPMMNYLHDSGILCMIFSFCSSKQLVRIPQVCKTWKATSDMVSNDLWENAYVADFGKYRWACRDAKHRHLAASRVVCEHQDRNNVVEAATDRTDWKDIFIRKHIAEKLIRFQRNPRTGFKHRTCSYLGCLQILKSTGQERRHDQMHERFLAKQQQRSKKKRASRRKKDG